MPPLFLDHVMTTENKKKIVSAIIALLTAILAAVFGLTSCNVTRTITTQSSYVQHGDTTTTIVTKTIESYDGSKRL